MTNMRSERSEKIKEYYIYRIIGIVSILIISFSFYLSPVDAAYERPEFKDGLTSNWHPGAFCIPCHYSLMSTEKAQNISVSCKNCHENMRAREKGKRKYEIDMNRVFNIHKDIVCIRCHIGTKEQRDVTAQDFHRIMPIDCINCHNYTNGMYQKPEKKNCSDCHMKGDPHVVHGDKVDKMCIACHGEVFANKYVNGTFLKPGQNISTKMLKETREYPTIVNFFEKILRILTNMIEANRNE